MSSSEGRVVSSKQRLACLSGFLLSTFYFLLPPGVALYA